MPDHSWLLNYVDARGRHYSCACGETAVYEGGVQVETSASRPVQPGRVMATPEVGDCVTINYGHEHFPGKSGIVAEVREGVDEANGATMVRVLISAWVLEEELR